MEISDCRFCTGCGLCANVCPVGAVTMAEGTNDFVFPVVDESACIGCRKCERVCPANQPVEIRENVRATYAAWNRDRKVRNRSSSGGVFSVLAESILEEGGVVAGVAMEGVAAKHIVVESSSDLPRLCGSKYVQSETGNIYRLVKEYLDAGRKVLFSGTPCQVHAMRQYLGGGHENILLVDVICHGVPSLEMLRKHIDEIGDGRIARDVAFRYKDPHWDYPYVRITWQDRGQPYQQLTVSDDYFHLFNVGLSIRESCHSCRYASTHRQGDVTLADYWGYEAHNFYMHDYLKGVSLVLANSEKGCQAIDSACKKMRIEPAELENAKLGNKCLTEPFKLPADKLEAFWHDYEEGNTPRTLVLRHWPEKYVRPNLLGLRHVKYRWRWVFKKPGKRS